MAFSASEAALEGFRLARREPRSIAAWSLVQLIFGIAVVVATMPFMKPLMLLQASQLQGAQMTPAQAMAALDPMLGFIGAIIPLELVVFSLLGAAAYRAVLRPQEMGLARLKFGMDEFRMAILWIELGLLLWAVGAVVFIVAATLAVLALHGSPASEVMAMFLAYLAALAAMVWLGVRLSLAAPLTFVSRRVQLFSAWRLTQGRFWPLFGCYLLSAVFMMIILMIQLSVTAVLTAIVTMVMSGGSLSHAMGDLMSPDYGTVGAYLSPPRIVGLLVNALLGGVYWSVMFAPAAQAYREIVGTGAPPRS